MCVGDRKKPRLAKLTTLPALANLGLPRTLREPRGLGFNLGRASDSPEKALKTVRGITQSLRFSFGVRAPTPVWRSRGATTPDAAPHSAGLSPAGQPSARQAPHAGAGPERSSTGPATAARAGLPRPPKWSPARPPLGSAPCPAT